MVDVSHVPYEIIRGEIATVFGQDSHGNNLSVTSFARWGCTIPYEILTRLGNRLDRVYV
jgi:alanine racemase